LLDHRPRLRPPGLHRSAYSPLGGWELECGGGCFLGMPGRVHRDPETISRLNRPDCSKPDRNVLWRKRSRCARRLARWVNSAAPSDRRSSGRCFNISWATPPPIEGRSLAFDRERPDVNPSALFDR